MACTNQALIVEQHGKKPTDERYADFLKMKREVDQVKEAGTAARIERFMKDLELLKTKNKPAYERLRDALREALRA